MKVCVVQPEYSFDLSRSDELFKWELDILDKFDESFDIIVFPEYSNVPALARTREEMHKSFEKYSDKLVKKVAETAKRCSATIFVNGIYETKTGLRNTTIAFDKNGKKAGEYFKQHLVPSEMGGYGLDKDYTYQFSEPTILEIDGIKYGFLTCYDFYFYENFANIARFNPDIIISCSYQRSDTHSALETMTKFCAYNTNSYILRSSVSLGEKSRLGGTSMIVAPNGKVLANMKNKVGIATAEIDPHKRYLKPAGFGNPDATHHSYIEAGRRPWKYRPAGSAIVLDNHTMPYPRICSHRGFNTIAPENSLPAYGAAVALGAQEIEFDLRETKDGVIVTIHDSELDVVSNGTGYVEEHTYQELLKYDFGVKTGAEFEGLQIATFEDILKKFACHVIMNVHIKSPDETNPLPEGTLKKIINLIKKYDCENYCYFMSGNEAILKQLEKLAPEIERCAGATDEPTYDLVNRALSANATKIQIYSPHLPYFEKDYLEKIIKRAHENGIRCNIFFSDDPEEAVRFLEMGIDTILTNDYLRVSNACKKFIKK